MLLSRAFWCSALAASLLAVGPASAAPPHGGHPGGGHPGGAPHAHGGYHTHYAGPYGYGYRGPTVVLGFGSGLGYGYGGYGGYGGYAYNPYGYGFGTFGVPAIPRTYSVGPSYRVLPAPPLNAVPVDPVLGDPANPVPQPLPVPATTGEAAPATITVIASEGATVSFDGIDTNQTGTRHSFTTRPIEPGAEKRVSVRVDGPGGPATLSVGVRAGEKATVDMRK
ncbi:hypothetical protein GobsT_56890 [Gemmata obscuriglobus]|nr:hypothetical protein GobsT_56890 [Gemmata obscuriglobus]VTS10204.1 unnamed protein product [Gemmata obscuriglobus UQM 2246]